MKFQIFALLFAAIVWKNVEGKLVLSKKPPGGDVDPSIMVDPTTMIIDPTSTYHYTTSEWKPESEDETFKRMDENKDKKLNFDEFIMRDKWDVDYEKQNFEEKDLNGDGVLNFLEHYKGSKHWHIEYLKDEFDREWDTNGDGVVSKAEYDAYYERQIEENKQYAKSTMDQFDIGDEKLNKEEVKNYLKSMYLKTKNDKDFNKLFKDYDKDKDGFWNLDEFNEFHSNTPYDRVEYTYYHGYGGSGTGSSSYRSTTTAQTTV